MAALSVVAALVALGFFIIMFKLGLKRVLGYDLYVDIALTAILMFLFAGSFSGMVVALIGGLIISIVLLVLRKLIGMERYEDYTFDNGKTETVWVRYSGWLN